MDWLKGLQEALPFVSGWPLVPKLMFSLIAVLVTALVLTLVWIPPTSAPAASPQPRVGVQSGQFMDSTDLSGLLLNFDSDAFKTPWKLEESLSGFKTRVNEVKNLFSERMNEVPPQFRGQMVDILTLVKGLERQANGIDPYDVPAASSYLPDSPKGIAIDATRWAILVQSNDLLRALGSNRQINSADFISKGGLATLGSFTREDPRISEAKRIAEDARVNGRIVDRYVTAVQEQRARNR